MRRRADDGATCRADARAACRVGPARLETGASRCIQRDVPLDTVAPRRRRGTAHARAGDAPNGEDGMSPFARLRSVRNILIAGVAIRALCWGVTLALSMLIVGALVDLHVGLSMGERYVLTAINVATFFAVGGTLLWRDRAVLNLRRVALWIEEHDPALEYRLVTAVEARREAIVANAETQPWSSTARARSGRAIAPALAGMVVAFVAPSF